MKPNPYLTSYKQEDVEKLYTSGSITPNIDTSGNLIIQNVKNEMYLSSITLPLINVVYNPIKVQTRYNIDFNEL